MMDANYLVYRIRERLADAFDWLAAAVSPPAPESPALPPRLPRARVITATFSFDLPTDASPQQIEEWLAFRIGGTSTMDGDNPLVDDDLESFGEIVLQDTGLHAHTFAYRHDGKIYVSRTLETDPYIGPNATEILCAKDHPAIVDRAPPWLHKEETAR